MTKPSKCERCNYDDSVMGPPDAFQDRYLSICEHCYGELSRLQSKMEDWADGDR